MDIFNKKIIIIKIFLAIFISTNGFAMQQDNRSPKKASRKLVIIPGDSENTSVTLEDAYVEFSSMFQSDVETISKLEQELDDILGKKAEIAMIRDELVKEKGQDAYDKAMEQFAKKQERLEHDIARKKARKEKREDTNDEISKTASDIIMTFAGNKINEDSKLKEIAIQTAIAADKDNKGKLDRLKFLFSKKNLTKTSFFGLITSLGLAGCYYGSKLLFNYLNAIIDRPSLVRESSRHDWKYQVKKMYYKKILGKSIKKEANLKEVILEEKMAHKLELLAEDTKKTRRNGLPYRHVLLYGLPGTGKTMFLRKLAEFCGMDYAILSGADFGQFKDGEDITELHKLFDWAEKSKKGLLIFVDEADAFLRDRRILNNQAKNLLNAFLTRTGTSSQKYMLVFATNYEDELDPAALSRINKKIYFPLPAFEERRKILDLYLNKYVTSDERSIKQGDTTITLNIKIDKRIDIEFLDDVTRRIKGFSGREIEQMVSEIRIAAYNIGDYVLTPEIFNDVVEEKIKEHKHDVECAKLQRKRYEKELGQEQISMKEQIEIKEEDVGLKETETTLAA